MKRLVCSLVMAGVLMTGCNNTDDDPDSRSNETTNGPEQPATSAPEALAAGGLTLPDNATDVTFEVIDPGTYLEAYVVTFKANRAAAIEFCGSGDLGGDLPAVALTDQTKQLLGPDAEPGDDKRYCGSLLPSDTAMDRQVLIESGDPALVRVAVARMGR